MKKSRDSRFELLRIISMILIVISHFSLESANYWENSGTPLDAVKIMYFDVLGQPGAIIFFMISGYFFFQKDNYKEQRNKAKIQVIKTWKKMFFYSVSVLLIIWYIYKQPTLKQIATALLPFSFNEYWFITCYIILMLLTPWINKLIKLMNYITFLELLILLFVLMFPALLNGGIINNVLLAFSGYLTGAFIKRFKSHIDEISNWQIITILVVTYLIMLLSVLVARVIGISVFHSAHFTHFPLSYILALCLFLLFSRLKPFSNLCINILASGAFAVYLITVHPLMVPFLWKDLVNIRIYQNIGILTPIVMLGVSVIIYLVCAVIDICLTGIIKLIQDKFNTNH